MSKKPRPLKDLPGYFPQKESGNIGDAGVVGMGNIMPPAPPKKSFFKQYQPLVFAVLAFAVLITASFVVNPTQQMTVIVDTNNPQVISQIVADGDGEVISVSQRDNTVYEVKLQTRRSKNSFLNWLRGCSDIRSADLID